MRIIIICLFLVAHSVAAKEAGDFSVSIPITTVHLIEVPANVSEFNDRNTGVIVEYMINDSDYVLGGVYKNSFYKKCGLVNQCDELSLTAGVGRVFSEDDKWRYAVELALATGYEVSDFLAKDSNLAPLAGLAATYHIGDGHAIKILGAFPGFIGLAYTYGYDGI